VASLALKAEFSNGGRLAESLIGSSAARLPAFSSAIRRHLILAYRPGWQAPSDLAKIARHIHELDPSIATMIIPHTGRNILVRRMAATLPTLVVSPGPLAKFRPFRGKIYQGRPIAKLRQIRRLQRAGVSVPLTALLTPDLRLDPAEWGEFVILKPTDMFTSSRGFGIQLKRTSQVTYVAPKDYPKGHPGRRGPMLVQQFINTGNHITSYRVLTLFGEPLYAMRDRNPEERASLDAPDAEIETTVIASQKIQGHASAFVSDPDILATARAAHAALPEIPLKGCDILREEATGKLYVLELNCGGNTWHFSSAQQARERAMHGPEFERERRNQFDAFRAAARVLVARTNEEAQ
jgi:hypothetical protein